VAQHIRHLRTLPGKQLYDRDYYAWVQAQVDALREHRIEDVDWENVAEEIEDLGKSEKRALRSQLARLVEHLLKLERARVRMRAENMRGWQISVRSSRRAAAELLAENPSLRSELPQILERAFFDARDEVLAALKLPDFAIAENAPWSAEQVMREDFQVRPRAKAC
jgi:hypothetical protein